MASTESSSRSTVHENARVAARALQDAARDLANEDPDAFELLVDMVIAQFNETRAIVVGGRAERVVRDHRESAEKEPVVQRRGKKDHAKVLGWNKLRKSLAIEYLILLCLAQHDDGPAIVDDIVEFVSRVFPIDDAGGRASLISKISRLKKDKGCLDDDEELKGVGYKISQSGRDYISKLKVNYLTKAEVAYIEEKLKA